MNNLLEIRRPSNLELLDPQSRNIQYTAKNLPNTHIFLKKKVKRKKGEHNLSGKKNRKRFMDRLRDSQISLTKRKYKTPHLFSSLAFDPLSTSTPKLMNKIPGIDNIQDMMAINPVQKNTNPLTSLKMK